MTVYEHELMKIFGDSELLSADTVSSGKTMILNPYYNYGAIVASVPLWAVGTALGIIAGNVLPLRIVSALSVALYGMFLAIIIPPSKENKIIGGLVIVCFILSYLASVLPVVSVWSSGNRTILLTVVISTVAAILFPVKNENI